MGKKCDFDREILVGARQGGLVSQKLLISWDSHTQQSLDTAENNKNRKHPGSSTSAGRNASLMREVRGEGPLVK